MTPAEQIDHLSTIASYTRMLAQGASDAGLTIEASAVQSIATQLEQLHAYSVLMHADLARMKRTLDEIVADAQEDDAMRVDALAGAHNVVVMRRWPARGSRA